MPRMLYLFGTKYAIDSIILAVTGTHLNLDMNFLQLRDHIYALEPEASLFIGKRNVGQVCNYYLGDPITDDEVAAVQTVAENIEIDILNTRYAPDCFPTLMIWST